HLLDASSDRWPDRAHDRGPPPPGPVPRLPGLRIGLPIRCAVRQVDRTVPHPHAEDHAGGAKLAVLATAALGQDHALRPANALGAAAGPDHAEAPPRSLPGVDPVEPAHAAVPAANERNAAPVAAALRQAAGDLAGRGETAGAGGALPRLCGRRLLPPDQPE